MKAMQIKTFGGPEVFVEAEVEKPSPGPNEVLVKVMATSVNPVDYKIRKAGSWAGIEPPTIIGYDASGIIEETGEAVTDFKPGDEVYYTPEIFGRQGTYAQYHVTEARLIACKPENLSHEEAAGIPLTGGTAWDALITRGMLEVGETVLIHGGSGGVGSLAVQIAKAAGAYVYTTAGKYNFDLLEKLGADRMIDYHSEDFVKIIRDESKGLGVDLVLDTVGGEILEKSIEITRPEGRLVSITNTSGRLNAAYRKNLTVHFLFLQRERYKLDNLRILLERGHIKPVIDSVMPLEKVADAHRKLEKGGVRGKIVLSVSH
jgi:NADPH2:quinone reductase